MKTKIVPAIAGPDVPAARHDEQLGLDVYHAARGGVLARSPEFERKKLGTHTVEVGFKCDHACDYCSSNALYRTHQVFKRIGRTAFTPGFAVIDPRAADTLRKQVHMLKPGDEVILCSKTDGWSPLAQELKLGRQCLRILLENSPARVRIITKGAAVREDFDRIEQHRDRVTLGISITGLPGHDAMVHCFERNASPPSARIAAMQQAARRGLRTFAMLCPMLPGLFSTEQDVRRLLELGRDWNVEGIWTEILNPRGPGIKRCVANLQKAGFDRQALAIHALRNQEHRSQYGWWLTRTMQRLCREMGLIDRLHVLSYQSSFSQQVRGFMRHDPEGVVWL
jgi:DNA repair photolyase